MFFKIVRVMKSAGSKNFAFFLAKLCFYKKNLESESVNVDHKSMVTIRPGGHFFSVMIVHKHSQEIS